MVFRTLCENKIEIHTSNNYERDRILEVIQKMAAENKYYKDGCIKINANKDHTIIVDSDLYFVNAVRGITFRAVEEVLNEERRAY